MLPVVLLGSFLGVQLNIIVPNAVLLIVLVLLLVFVTIKTTLKGVRMFREETKQKTKYVVPVIYEVSERHEGSNEENIELNNVSTPDNPADDSLISFESDSEYNKPMMGGYQNKDEEVWNEMEKSSFSKSGKLKKNSQPLQEGKQNRSGSFMDNCESIMIKSLDGSHTRILKQVKKEERSHLQLAKMFPIIVLFITLTIVSYLRESHKSETAFINIQRCSVQDWGLLGVFVAIGAIITTI